MHYQLDDLIDVAHVTDALSSYGSEGPFDHCVIDGFFKDTIARALESEIPDFHDPLWHRYDNAIENKKVCNNWNLFPPLTYSVFTLLNSDAFLTFLSQTICCGNTLYSDAGLNGGGWHIHARGGKLNTHLDYSLHPKTGLQRKLNIIVYLNAHWQDAWGGQLGLWEHRSDDMQPGALKKSVSARFNRAVIFDTTQNSWHGLPEPLTCPEDQYRKSIAAYFLCDAAANIDPRGKALFAPTASQKNDRDVLQLIKDRADVKTSATVYQKKPS